VIAAGYANGAIVISRPASRDVVFARGAGGGAVDVLAWSPDGQSLAFALSSGEVGHLLLPARLFRDEAEGAP
jgi:hypothetical protein